MYGLGRRIGALSWAVLGGLWVPGAAQAQSDVSAPGSAQAIEKIERGWFVSVEAGPMFLVAPDASADYGLGFAAQLHLGLDVAPVLRLSVGATLVGAEGTERVGEGLNEAVVLRDRFYVAPSVRGELALLTTERDFLWVRAEVGLGIMQGSDMDMVDNLGPSFGGAVAFEHFATLRHFSFGAQAGLTVFLQPDLAVAIHLMPTLRYTF